MQTHDVTIEIPKKSIQAKDIKFTIKSDGGMLGCLLVSKGNIEWIPANNSVRKRRLTWERFAQMMASEGRKARIKKKS
jgi:hypothetical protein